ncbi:MAG: hypothetical protein UW04_C0021G0005 [Parcubacteria group bacterium GW2011_GWB1_43_8]|nr:MAG: hypothetical protein UW04_C0021G0005 [Parcubacteria group bacterium GW2011_GWB1_43_8]
MATITIPKNLIKNDDLVVIPRKEYEEFYQWKETTKLFKTFTPTAAQKKDFKKAREDYKQKKYITLDEFKRRLGIKN